MDRKNSFKVIWQCFAKNSTMFLPTHNSLAGWRTPGMMAAAKALLCAEGFSGPLRTTVKLVGTMCFAEHVEATGEREEVRRLPLKEYLMYLYGSAGRMGHFDSNARRQVLEVL